MENIRAPISMEFHGNFCIDIFHGGLGHFLWNSMENVDAGISMEIGVLMFSMEFHGKCPNPPCKCFPWKSMEKFPWKLMS